MKHTLKIAIFLSLILSLSACLDFSKFTKEEKLSLDDDFNIVKVNREYSLAIPKYMSKANDLNDEASLQYSHIFKEAYVVVIDEPKEELKEVFLEMDEWDSDKTVAANYRDIQMGFLSEGINISSQMPARALTINGMDAEIVDLEGRVADIDYDIAYKLAFVEGDEKVYMIMTWTLADKKEDFDNTYEQIITSFDLL